MRGDSNEYRALLVKQADYILHFGMVYLHFQGTVSTRRVEDASLIEKNHANPCKEINKGVYKREKYMRVGSRKHPPYPSFQPISFRIMSQPPAPNFTEQHGAAFHRGGTPVAAPNAFQQGPYFHYPQVPVGGIFPQQYPPQYIPAPPHSGYPLNIPNPQGVPYQAVPPMHAPQFLHPFPTSQAHATMGGPHHNVQHCQVEPAQQAPPRRATRGPLRDIQPSLPGPGAPALSQPTRQRPNAEPRPGGKNNFCNLMFKC